MCTPLLSLTLCDLLPLQRSFKALLKRLFKDISDVEDSIPETVKKIRGAKEVQLDAAILSHAVGFLAELAVGAPSARDRNTILAVLKQLHKAKPAVGPRSPPLSACGLC